MKLSPIDPKLLGFYTFTIPALDKATDHVEEMVLELSKLIPDIPSLQVRPPAPDEIFQTCARERQTANAAGDLRHSQGRGRL